MSETGFLTQVRQHLVVGASLVALCANLAGPMSASAAVTPAETTHTVTPIKHVIVIIGENRSFDHVFATYVPKSGQTVSNLLSRGIIEADGTPGPNYSLAAQYRAVDNTVYQISPGGKKVYDHIPPPVAGGPTTPYFSSVVQAREVEPGTLAPNTYYELTVGGTGLTAYSEPDTRIHHVFELPGEFQLTPEVPYDAYANSPVHRFYQMWQQTDCSVSHATASNPSGCLNDLFPWVEVTIGAGSDGSSGFTTPPTNYLSTGEGSTSMEFFNVQQGDAPYLTSLANHVEFGLADSIWYSDGKGNVATPPANQVEIHNPLSGTNNWYDDDGYGG